MTAKERHYRQLISKGFAEKDARRLATGMFQLGAIRTRATFAAGLDRVGILQDPVIRKDRLAKAAAAGVSTAGKIYMGGVASGVGTADGWITEMDAEAEIKNLCHKNGYGCEGAINIEKREAESDPWEDADNLTAVD